MLVVTGDGTIVSSWFGPVSPFAALREDLFDTLDLDDGSPDAARIQLLLAAGCGALASAWQVLAADAPGIVVRRDGSAVALLWQPIVVDRRIDEIAVFAYAAERPREEADDPAERNRLCVEALGLVDECALCIVQLRTAPSARHAVHRMFRAVHTIKGSARGSRLQPVSRIAHEIEEILDVLRRSDEPTITASLDHVAGELARLRGEISAARPQGEVDDAMTELLSQCRAAIGELHVGLEKLSNYDHDATAAVRDAIHTIASGAERAGMTALGAVCAAAATAAELIGEIGVEPELLVPIEELDEHVELAHDVYREGAATNHGAATLATLARLLDAAAGRSVRFDDVSAAFGEVAIPSLIAAVASDDSAMQRRARGVLRDAVAMFEPGRPRDDASLRFERAQRELLGIIDHLESATDDAFGGLIDNARAVAHRLVWTPVASLARQITKTARSLSADLGKQVAVDIAVGELLVAPPIGRVISEIFVHAVRNAIDHGIETAPERVASGKAPSGTIRVEAYEVGARLVLVLSDDGRGIDIAKVRAAAIARELVSAEAAMQATEAELLELLFVPGFSTASSVTVVSGRGVGMDVIKCLAEEHDGTVQLASALGRGTQLVIELPFAPS
jgi:two-component system chemotaxis sensor kinase CheA